MEAEPTPAAPEQGSDGKRGSQELLFPFFRIFWGCAEGGAAGCWCVMRDNQQDNDFCHLPAQRLCLTLITCLALKAQRDKKKNQQTDQNSNKFCVGDLHFLKLEHKEPVRKNLR